MVPPRPVHTMAPPRAPQYRPSMLLAAAVFCALGRAGRATTGTATGASTAAVAAPSAAAAVVTFSPPTCLGALVQCLYCGNWWATCSPAARHVFTRHPIPAPAMITLAPPHAHATPSPRPQWSLSPACAWPARAGGSEPSVCGLSKLACQPLPLSLPHATPILPENPHALVRAANFGAWPDATARCTRGGAPQAHLPCGEDEGHVGHGYRRQPELGPELQGARLPRRRPNGDEEQPGRGEGPPNPN